MTGSLMMSVLTGSRSVTASQGGTSSCRHLLRHDGLQNSPDSADTLGSTLRNRVPNVSWDLGCSLWDSYLFTGGVCVSVHEDMRTEASGALLLRDGWVVDAPQVGPRSMPAPPGARRSCSTCSLPSPVPLVPTKGRR